MQRSKGYTGPVEPFRFTGQSITVLALMAAVAIIVGVAAPFGSIALGAAALLALGAVLLKAMLRTRDWWPLTVVEGTIAASCLVLMVGGLGVVGYSIVRLGEGWHMTIGWPSALNEASPAVQRSTRNVMYTDPELQQKVKDGLRAAGIPYTVTTRKTTNTSAGRPSTTKRRKRRSKRSSAGRCPTTGTCISPTLRCRRNSWSGWKRKASATRS